MYFFMLGLIKVLIWSSTRNFLIAWQAIHIYCCELWTTKPNNKAIIHRNSKRKKKKKSIFNNHILISKTKAILYNLLPPSSIPCLHFLHLTPCKLVSFILLFLISQCILLIIFCIYILIMSVWLCQLSVISPLFPFSPLIIHNTILSPSKLQLQK